MEAMETLEEMSSTHKKKQGMGKEIDGGRNTYSSELRVESEG